MKIETRGKLVKSGLAERDRGKHTFAYYVGIDPDVDRSGYAAYSKSQKRLLHCTTLPFFHLLEVLKKWSSYRNEPNKVVVHIEGAWLSQKSNWHFQKAAHQLTEKDKRIGERIAKNVGNNHQVGKLIVEMCQQLDLSFVVRDVITPLFKDEEDFRKITKWNGGLTNADARSAANYVFGF